MDAIWALTLLQAVAAEPPSIDLTRGPSRTTTVAVEVVVDAEGKVVSCRPGALNLGACDGFTKGRVVTAPLRRNGKPVGGIMTVSTTTVVAARPAGRRR